jgi:hypothetical protein
LSARPFSQTQAPTLSRLLTMDGDARLRCDPRSGRNRYGCLPHPLDTRPSFASSTASSISKAAFARVEDLRGRVAGADPELQAAEFERLRAELTALCGLEGPGAPAIVFAPAGTDLHLIVAQLSGAESRLEERGVLRVLMTETSETGNGVPAALAGRHYNARAPLSGEVEDGGQMGGCRPVELCMLSSRGADSRPRGAELDAEVERLCVEAASAGKNVLLIVSDVSKTGLLAPSPSLALDLLRRFPGRVDVLVDACQFRLSPATLRAYLGQGFLIALTGSKFVTGPAFSAALLVPPALASLWQRRSLPASLSAYSARSDWPKGWEGRGSMVRECNLGLLLRWEAALTEMKAFRLLPDKAVEGFLRAFAVAVTKRLASGGALEALPLGPLDRGPFAQEPGWDAVPSLFPFLLKRDGYLDHAETRAVYETLLERHGHIGQPARCGARQGREVSALRICASMRLAVDALAPGGRGTEAVVKEALVLLDQTERLVRG